VADEWYKQTAAGGDTSAVGFRALAGRLSPVHLAQSAPTLVPPGTYDIHSLNADELHRFIGQRFTNAGNPTPTKAEWTQAAVEFGLNQADAERLAEAWYASSEPKNDVGFRAIVESLR
jgi:hypothetical protein